MTEDTSAYWRKLLGLNEKENSDILKEFYSPHLVFRQGIRSTINFLLRSYIRIRSFGAENLPEKPPYIIAPNHVSSADFACVFFSLPKAAKDDLYVLVTKHFYDNPFTRFFIKAYANAARIDTVEDFLPAMKAASSLLRLGKSVYINPEGTRSESGELLPFRVGVGVLAVELNVPVVPVYIDGTHKILPPGSIFMKPGLVNVHFGKPISAEKYQEKKKTTNAYYVYKEMTEELRKSIIKLKEKASKHP